MKRLTLAAMALLVCGAAQAASEEVELHLVSPSGWSKSLKPKKVWSSRPILTVSRQAITGFIFIPKAAANPP